MNRQDAIHLIQRYKNFPATEVFGIKPYNYPIFHLLECFSKGWRIDYVDYHERNRNDGMWTIDRFQNDDLPFDALAHEIKQGENNVWTYVAHNPNINHPAIGFVQEDLYARYVGKCNPLKTPQTTWGFTPFEAIAYNKNFQGRIGRHTPLYCLEIDLDTTDIVGERNPKLPWHYLQQTISWKPYTDIIDWNHIQANPQ